MKTILLVEDEIGIAEMLVIFLEREQYRVVAAANGIEALKALKETKADVILMDVMMPFMGGPELGEAIRSDPATCHIPIVFQTSVEEWAVRERFSDFEAFFLKPYEMKDLLSCLAVLANSGRGSDPALRDNAAGTPFNDSFDDPQTKLSLPPPEGLEPQ